MSTPVKSLSAASGKDKTLDTETLDNCEDAAKKKGEKTYVKYAKIMTEIHMSHHNINNLINNNFKLFSTLKKMEYAKKKRYE